MRRSSQPECTAVVAPPPVSRRAAATQCVIALGFIASFVAVGIGAASTAQSSPLLPAVEAYCLLPILAVLTIALLPAVDELRGRSGGVADGVAIRRFRRQLDELPETPHPLQGEGS